MGTWCPIDTYESREADRALLNLLADALPAVCAAYAGSIHASWAPSSTLLVVKTDASRRGPLLAASVCCLQASARRATDRLALAQARQEGTAGRFS